MENTAKVIEDNREGNDSYCYAQWMLTTLDGERVAVKLQKWVVWSSFGELETRAHSKPAVCLPDYVNAYLLNTED